MLEQGRISNRQAAILLINTITPTSFILLPGAIYRAAHQDAWLSIILITLFSIAIGLVIATLATRFPRRTIIQYSGDIVGQPLGKIISLVFILSIIYVDAFIVREVGDIFKMGFMPETPLVAFAVGLVLTAAYIVRHGLEVLARVSEFILPLGIIMVLTVAGLVSPENNIENFTPLLEKGIMPVLSGSYIVIPFYAITIVMTMIIPFATYPKKAKKTITSAIIAVGIFLLVITATAIGVLGGTTGNFNYATLQLAAYISLADFIERIEPLVLIIWISGCLIEIGTLYYCSVLAVAQWLNLKEFKALVLPIGALVVVLAIIRWDNIIQLIHELTQVMPLYTMALWAGLPLLLLIIAWLRGKKDQGELKHE